jgi:hypothetical protein
VNDLLAFANLKSFLSVGFVFIPKIFFLASLLENVPGLPWERVRLKFLQVKTKLPLKGLQLRIFVIEYKLSSEF